MMEAATLSVSQLFAQALARGQRRRPRLVALGRHVVPKYSGAHLRALRAAHGVGSPRQRTVASNTAPSDEGAQTIEAAA